MKISEILLKYETDKVTDHCYGDTYDELFNRFDRNAKLNILEIGVQKGGSLLAWEEYFPNSKITGIDILDTREYISTNIRYIWDDVKVINLDEEFDIIIDDGSHLLQDVIAVIRYFSNKIKKGGILIVEDLQTTQILAHINQSFRTIDLRHINGNYDDYLVIIEK